jgi:hypothetical protein
MKAAADVQAVTTTSTILTVSPVLSISILTAFETDTAVPMTYNSVSRII